MVEKIINFAKVGSETSTRTADVVKGIKVLMVQFYTLLSMKSHLSLIDNEDHKAIFADSQKLGELKRNFLRFAAEEQMRRVQKNASMVVENHGSILFPDYSDSFVKPLWEKRRQ